MAVPWLQIVQLVPSILDVSRELLRKSRQLTPAPAPVLEGDDPVAVRILQLEENERRQAELVSQMAEQLAQVTRALTVLHRRVIWLTAATGVAIVLAAIGIAR